MSPFEVNLVTAFGRGETLALALEAQGFSVRVLEFSAAFPAEYRRGPGPFPVALIEYLPEQREWLSEAVTLPRGVAFWLPEGPLELAGPMAPFYLNSRKDVQNLKAGTTSADFKVDWLRRFLLQWTSAFQSESWDTTAGTMFPWANAMGMIPSYEETQIMTFERFRAKGHQVVSCSAVQDVQFDGSRLNSIAVQAGGQDVAYQAPQWVWCLSSVRPKF